MDANALDMDTLGYFLYMDEMEKRQKEASPDTLSNLFDDNSEEDDDSNDEDE